jgi:hypothetical protein
MKIFKFASVVLLMAFCGTCFGQEDFPFSEVKFKGLFGTRAGDAHLYCLLGNGMIRTIRSDEEAATVSTWRSQHPNANAVPVSIAGEGSRMRIVYIWAVDGNENLNLQLIKKGVFPGSVMLDAVQFDQLSKGSPRTASIEAGYAYGRKLANTPVLVEQPPRRLVSEARYGLFLKELIASESAAKVQTNGIWSEKFKDLRDTEEITPLSEVAAEILANQGATRRAPPVQPGTAPR